MTFTRHLLSPPAPKFSPLPQGRKLTREEVAAALAERVAAGTMSFTAAVALLEEYDAYDAAKGSEV